MIFTEQDAEKMEEYIKSFISEIVRKSQMIYSMDKRIRNKSEDEYILNNIFGVIQGSYELFVDDDILLEDNLVEPSLAEDVKQKMRTILPEIRKVYRYLLVLQSEFPNKYINLIKQAPVIGKLLTLIGLTEMDVVDSLAEYLGKEQLLESNEEDIE